MPVPETQQPSAWLVPIAGPELAPIEIPEKPGGITLGRHEQCDVRLPLTAEQVSRTHARFERDGLDVRVTDLASRWGTYVNGVKLQPQHPTLLAEGDLIRITPWTFTLSTTSTRRGLQSSEDAVNTVVRSVGPDTQQPLAQDMLTLLLESAAAIHAAASEKELAERLIDVAIRGTGLVNAALLRPVDNLGHYEVIASRLGAMAERAGPASFSRSLLSAAAGGQVAELGGQLSGNISESIVLMKINAALCVPLMLGGSPAAFLYLDSRGSIPQSLRPNASGFCVALGRMASLALANLKRQDMERREALFNAELAAAATAQKYILPPRHARHGPLNVLGESRPGQHVGGDFFDIIPLSNGRLAVTVGDVSGKGISASVLMTASQGFLHAALERDQDLSQAITALNRFIHPRRPASKFVTMWAAIVDSRAGTLQYVDAGHSYAVLRRGDGTFRQLDDGGGLPVGVDDATEYHAATIDFGPGDALMVVSDGIIEQFASRAETSGYQQFGMDGLMRHLQTTHEDPVAALFAALVEYAGTDKLADDATVVWVHAET
jgi:serine phosphatase RsbU (regulator of sigma subunit)